MFLVGSSGCRGNHVGQLLEPRGERLKGPQCYPFLCASVWYGKECDGTAAAFGNEVDLFVHNKERFGVMRLVRESITRCCHRSRCRVGEQRFGNNVNRSVGTCLPIIANSANEIGRASCRERVKVS